MTYLVMLLRNVIFVAIAVMVQCLGFPVLAIELNQSARSDIWDNPFLAYGYNPNTKVIAGYLAALRTAPGRTDECKLVFKGNLSRLEVKYLEGEWVPGGENRSDIRVYIKTEGNRSYLVLPKKSLRGDCDWILPFNVGSQVFETSDKVAIVMEVPNVGTWVGVYAIGAKRAKFHSQPDSASVRKEYLVEGDVIYVFDERPEWYLVQYENGKRKTVGWIRKTDTVQP